MHLSVARGAKIADHKATGGWLPSASFLVWFSPREVRCRHTFSSALIGPRHRRVTISSANAIGCQTLHNLAGTNVQHPCLQTQKLLEKKRASAF